MTGIRTIFAKGGAVLATALFVSPAAAQDEPLVLQPSSAWHLNYAEESCRLVRQFGEGDDQTTFYIERHGPGDSFFMLVAGKPLRASHSKARTSFQFGPGANAVEDGWQLGRLGKLDPALMLNTRLFPVAAPTPITMAALQSLSDSHADAPATEDHSQPEILTAPPPVSYLQEASINWLEIKRGNRQPVRLALGSMGEPMAAMRTCTEELMTHWGIDVAAHRTLQRMPVSVGNPRNWVMGYQYPTELLRQGMEGSVDFRLLVGPDGNPTQCKTQNSTRPVGFDEVVCQSLMRRAKFEPALDAQGNPIASYFQSAVRFQIAD